MSYGLLTSLSKYHPRENTTPIENFVTEAFAWTLRQQPSLTSYFLSQVIEKADIEYAIQGDGEWLTQTNFDGKYPDLVYRQGDTAIIFEHKIWAQLHRNQLKNYRDYASEHFSQYCIVLISATAEQHAQDPDLALCWFDIYQMIEHWLADQGTMDEYLCREFLNLLKNHGLGPKAPISDGALRYYYGSWQLPDRLSELTKSLMQMNWPEGLTRKVHDRKGKLYGHEWGRVGIEFYEKWAPALFLGTLLHGDDHKVPPLKPELGPDFCLIVDIDEKLPYRSNEQYLQLKEDMRKRVGELGEGWSFYDHLQDESVSTPNKWHPLYYRKPLLDVLAGTTTHEEQVTKVFNVSMQMLDLMSSIQAFHDLRQHFINHPESNL